MGVVTIISYLAISIVIFFLAAGWIVILSVPFSLVLSPFLALTGGILYFFCVTFKKGVAMVSKQILGLKDEFITLPKEVPKWKNYLPLKCQFCRKRSELVKSSLNRKIK